MQDNDIANEFDACSILIYHQQKPRLFLILLSMDKKFFKNDF